MYLFDLFEDAGKKLVIFDIDDTLVNTNTRVIVRRDGQPVHSLNSHEFTHYKLKPGETFDFGAFRDAEDFFEHAQPIAPMIEQLKNDIATGNRVVMVTARADFNSKEIFLKTFEQWHVDMSRVHVYRAGNDTDPVPIDEKKARIIRRLLTGHAYNKAIMYDDSVPNLESFVRLHNEYPGVKFYAWHVDRKGHAREYTRGYRAEDIDETIRQVKGGYKVFSKKGKNLGGPYPSHKQAAKRLGQVEYFKHMHEDKDNGLYELCDYTLVELCAGIIQHQKQDADKYGLVAAAVIDPERRVVKGINYLLPTGKRVHAERAAMANYIRQHGAIPAHSIVVTTLSPCANRMSERHGPSCTELLNDSPITRVYAGYRDPTQRHLAHDDFDVVYTQNSKIESVCKQIADCFLKESAYTDPANYCGEGVAEEVNPEVTSDDYTEPSQNVRMGDFVFNARTFTGALGSPNAKGLQIRAYDPKNLKSSIGSADFIVRKDKKGNQWLESDDTEVNDEYRSKGVSTMMYAFAKSLGNDIKDSPYKSKAGSDMWKKWGSDAKHLVGEQGVAEGRENYNGVNILFQKDDDEIFVKASAGGRELGHVLFVIDGEYLMPQDLEVEERYRGQGIAQTMYDYVKSKGYKIRRSGQQTDAGAGFWDKHKPGKNIWEQSMAEGATKIHSDKEPKLTGFSFQQLDSLCESAGSDYVKFDRAIKKNLVLPAWTNTLELYGVYARKLNEVKSKTLAEGTQSDIEQQLFDQLSQRALGSMDSASVGDRVSLLHLATLNIPGHKVVAKLNGFLTPKQIVKIVNTGRFQQLEFADGSRYPEKDGGDIFQQTQAWNMTKLFPSADAASKAFMFYVLEGQKLSDVLDFQTNVDQGVAENFADGRNPGRKGLAKRSGVNTKASVSSLRKTARHSTGEKARMAHWLANMKAGRAKKK